MTTWEINKEEYHHGEIVEVSSNKEAWVERKLVNYNIEMEYPLLMSDGFFYYHIRKIKTPTKRLKTVNELWDEGARYINHFNGLYSIAFDINDDKISWGTYCSWITVDDCVNSYTLFDINGYEIELYTEDSEK